MNKTLILMREETDYRATKHNLWVTCQLLYELSY